MSLVPASPHPTKVSFNKAAHEQTIEGIIVATESVELAAGGSEKFKSKLVDNKATIFKFADGYSYKVMGKQTVPEGKLVRITVSGPRLKEAEILEQDNKR